MFAAALGHPALHHVGIVVRDLEAAVARYRALGFGEPALGDVPDQGVRIASFHAGAGYVELLTPTVPDTGVARFLEARGEGLHHVAYGVPALDDVLRRLAAAGFELIDAHPRRGIHDWRVAFLHPRSCGGVLVELVEVEA
ncbi:MAG: methylmalonyl-CoA epimerase [Sphaerobacter sp.]|nr:methylmalonyl-CoA epimerase [Sphaerobacter sp.]